MRLTKEIKTDFVDKVLEATPIKHRMKAKPAAKKKVGAK